MATYIRIEEYCVHYKLPTNFIEDLVEAGLLQIENSDAGALNEEQFSKLERFRQMFFDLQINLEGIETIDHLLERQQQLQKELAMVKSKLRLYE